MGDLYALDFDGVLCDSCGETAVSAVKAAKVRWPGLFDNVDSTLENWIVDQMVTVRPVVETGYETLLLVRLLLETRIPSIRKSSVSEGLTVEGILDNWLKLKPVIMEEWDENREILIDLFGKVRDEWLENDFHTWIGANRFYPGVPDALKFASSRIFIVTTKQGRFADALLRELAGVTLPPERIFGLGTGPKVEVLKQLQKKPEHQGMKLHFVEDRLATLKNVIKEPELDGWNLYLVDWGYNTQKEREEAASIPRIRLLELSDFRRESEVEWGIFTLWTLIEFFVIAVERALFLLSSQRAAKVRWPGLFDNVDSTLESWIVEQMFTVRPVVETGYENLLLVRLLLEMRIPSIRKSSVSEGLTVEGILDNWSKLKPVIMEEWDENREILIDLFGKVRDEWLENDLDTWIGANRFYPGVPDALKFASSRIFIVTTKQGRFADALLRELAGVTIPPERIFGLGTGPKVEVLKQLQKKPEHQGMKLHFVEDRLATLKNVIKEPELDGWNLYLGDWGYNTKKEREEAASIPRIRLLELSDFSKKLK
ncbi:hypothetical protein F8388_006648 [Cannabis sativa]|uniref:HAD-like domain-containing protein n=1 Tax=Cannabis sativa TaxID=3483 RepID=A0A7J6GUU0_CANSA|nr:hypothetical protein F8388_006648 [Cannabis sativa]KAF4392889.1 hypothetical protein G4B88_011884 [Cannabis sativa]